MEQGAVRFSFGIWQASGRAERGAHEQGCRVERQGVACVSPHKQLRNSLSCHWNLAIDVHFQLLPLGLPKRLSRRCTGPDLHICWCLQRLGNVQVERHGAAPLNRAQLYGSASAAAAPRRPRACRGRGGERGCTLTGPGGVEVRYGADHPRHGQPRGHVDLQRPPSPGLALQRCRQVCSRYPAVPCGTPHALLVSTGQVAFKGSKSPGSRPVRQKPGLPFVSVFPSAEENNHPCKRRREILG